MKGGAGRLAVTIVGLALLASCGGTGPTPAPRVLVTWDASAAPGVTGYNVYRADSPAGPFHKVTTSPTGALSYIDLTVGHGKAYHYAATAISPAGESVFSNAAAVTP